MKHMNNHYGAQRIFGKSKMNLQLFSEDDPEEDEEEPEDEPEDEDPEEEEEKGKGKLYTKKQLGAIVSAEVKKALEEYKKEQSAKSEAKKLEDMTDEQRKAHEQKQKDDEMAELKRKVARMELSKTASKLLKESEIDPSEEVLDFVVGKDAEETSANIAKFVVIKNAIVQQVEKARNTGKTPKALGGDSGKKLTKEDIAKMEYKDVLAYKEKYPEEYKKIMED